MGIEWIIGGLIAAIVGTGMQMYASNEAQKAADREMQEGYMQLQSAQEKINQNIADATSMYESDKRIENQTQEAERIANDIKTDVSESQAIRDEQQATAGNVSSDYEQARSQSQANTKNEMNAFADLIGKIRSAGTSRMNEGFKFNHYGEQIGTLARNAQGDMSVAQARAQDALHSKDGLANMGKIVSALGTVASMGGAAAGLGAGAAATAGQTAGQVAAQGATTAAASTAASAPTFWTQAANLWNGLSTPTKAGLIGLGATGMGALASNPWRR